MEAMVENQETMPFWYATPRQTFALKQDVQELFFGGAKGGGKSDFLLGDFLQGTSEYGEHLRGILFRKTYPALEAIIDRSKKMYPAYGAEYREGTRTWHFPSGATLRFRHLESNKDVASYQGHEFQWIGFDEVTDFTDDYCYVFVLSLARSSHNIPCYVRSTGNPGRVGHQWVKSRFIDVAEPETVYEDPITGMSRMFVPSKLDDNPYLGDEYESFLLSLPEHLYKAFRQGDWSVYVGQAFGEYRYEKHVHRPFPIEPHWYRFCSMDWGYKKPFSIGWWAVDELGRMIRYREWYGCVEGRPNTGIEMGSKDVAEAAWKMSIAEGCKDMVADPACWSNDDDQPTIAQEFSRAGWQMVKANNDRINGLARVHERMNSIAPDGLPTLIVFNTCTHWIRTVPALPVDEKKPEDIDTNAEDHAYDETRYAVMSPLSLTRVQMKTPPRYMGGLNRDEETVKEYDPLDSDDW